MGYTTLQDEYIKQSKTYMKGIRDLKKGGDKVGAAKLGLEFAYFKVDYFKQFLDGMAATNYTKIYEDEYSSALRCLGMARDECMDLGVYEE